MTVGVVSCPPGDVDVSDWKSRVTFVYFVRVRDAVKIGTSGRLAERISTIQCNNPDPVELVGALPFSYDEAVSIESEFHSRLGALGLRLLGEWFKDGPEVEALLHEAGVRSTESKARAE